LLPTSSSVQKSALFILVLLVVALITAVGLPIQPTGLIHSMPDEQGVSSYATGTYIGDGILLTNWHVLKSLNWRREFFKLPLWSEHIYNFEVPIEWIIFTEQEIDLAIAKLPTSRLDWLNVAHACLSTEPVEAGEVLEVVSSPLGQYPPVQAQLIVTDPIVQPRVDIDPQVKDENRYEVISFATQVQPGQESLIEPGSSGGTVTNEAGELAGLVWSRYDLPDGTREVLITPVSAWLPLLKNADIAPKYKEYILEQVCK